jgi:rRNA maturation protein Rpf1
MVLLITTSRNPSHNLRRMSKIITYSMPKSLRLTRGNLNLNEIFRYCWNHQIFRLLILQKHSENSILVKAFSIEEKPRPIQATIKLSDIITLQKHVKPQRIMIERVKIEFKGKLGKKIKKNILDFFLPITQNAEPNHSTKLLTISFEKNSSDSLIGHAVLQNSSMSPPLYTIHINSVCNSYES